MKWPTHLNCVYCPSQAFNGGEFKGMSYVFENVQFPGGKVKMRRYVCAAGHKFWVEPEVSRDNPSQ